MKKKIIIVSTAAVIVLVIAGILFVQGGVIDPKNQVSGNNANAAGYQKEFVKPLGTDILTCLEKMDENYEEEDTIFQLKDGNVMLLFQKGTDYVTCYELLETDRGYYRSGSRKLVPDFSKKNNGCTYQQTFLADLSQSTKKMYKKMIKGRYEVLPAWGISDDVKVENLAAEGQTPDKVYPVQINGKEYYLWIILDLKTSKNAVEIELEER